ncbi:hypothetical protein E7Z53_18200 [Kocuria salina]|uniref:hypothetical protein n=1 Tax=Kocuria salina TaxID=1929416 RepID=UPI0015947D96|nr:hypothetical protein [Kocuria salina]NVC25351.1 hypothetical protein [Kocuria salina]
MPHQEFDVPTSEFEPSSGATAEPLLEPNLEPAVVLPWEGEKAAETEPAVPEIEEERLQSAPEPAAPAFAASIDRLTDELRKHHERASHRERVIDSLHTEVESLRRGERRSLLRPILTATARLHDDLVRQAESLPENFDARRAANLLQSFADSVELMLDDHGVRIDVPELGSDFDARRHRTIGKTGTPEAGYASKIAEVRRGSYVDSETGSILSHAEVVVFVYEPEVAEPDANPTANTAEKQPAIASAEVPPTPYPNGVAE